MKSMIIKKCKCIRSKFLLWQLNVNYDLVLKFNSKILFQFPSSPCVQSQLGTKVMSSTSHLYFIGFHYLMLNGLSDEYIDYSEYN